MKTLPFHREEGKDRVLVECADGMVEVHSRCAYCSHCVGVRVGKRQMPAPQRQALQGVIRGSAPDENLMNAAIMFNTLVRDGAAIECDDDSDLGYHSLYRR